MRISLILLLISLFSLSCDSPIGETLFDELPAKNTGIRFKNILRETEEFNVLKYGYFYNGGGVAVGDINNDGLPDIYFTGNLMASHLYLNQGNMKFKEIAVDAGVEAAGLWNTGVTMADVNGDGWLDIYVCRSAAVAFTKRQNLLFINNGDLTFTEQADLYGIADVGYSTQAAFFDYDRDGDLDLYVLNHSVQDFAGFSKTLQRYKSQNNPSYGDKLYRNDGPINMENFDSGGFMDVTINSGIKTNVLGFGLGLAISDLNGDGWPDIYISNDYNEQDYLYINQQDGKFKESLAEQVNHVSLFSMGSDIADINNDGLTDILTLDMLPADHYRQKMTSGPDNYDKYQLLKAGGFHRQSMRNMLQLNNGDGTFSEVGQLAGVSNSDWSWSALFADYDNDGYKDLFITNGYKRDYTNMDFLAFSVDEQIKSQQTGTTTAINTLLEKMPSIEVPNFMYRNNGSLGFVEATEAWGFGKVHLSNGATYADLDGDGDLDILTNNVNEPASIYRNNSETKGKDKNYLRVRLKGKSMNTWGIGAKVKITTASQQQFSELYSSRGFQSAVEPILHFGLGKDSVITELRILWPDGQEQKITEGLSINQTLTIDQAKEEAPRILSEISSPYFSSNDQFLFIHQENDFVDFKQQLLLPRMNSRLGPSMAKADVNGDGKEDLYMGGAMGQAGQLLIQGSNGTFRPSSQATWIKDRAHEDVHSIFFDADGDKDMDLYVVSGGVDVIDKENVLQDRLYLNTNANFVRANNKLPKMESSGSVAAPSDIDGDGDMDLFVGGRLIPGAYPSPASSYILINDGKGNFTDETASIAPNLVTLGMVTDAVWVELNGDASKELVIAGEWMPIQAWTYREGKLEDVSVQYFPENLSGWWNTILAADFDGDGDDDLVIGNEGRNAQYKASSQEPIQLVYKDFDANGSVDPIMTYYIDGQSYPMASKDDLLSQLAGLKRKFVSYESYANARLEDIFTQEELKDAKILEANNMESLFLEQTESGFEARALPLEAQFAPIYALKALDVNKDGHLDLVAAGNFQSTRVKFGESDANFGQLFLGDGKGGFSYVPQSKSGLRIRGDVRNLERIKTIDREYLIFGRNNDSAIMYSLE